MIDRRRFLKGSSWAVLGGASFPQVAWSSQPAPARAGRRPRHIIHMVADGMSIGTLTCADHFSQLLRGRGLTWTALADQPRIRTGWMNMRSHNSLVTDSSAASSSWGSGSRIINGRVNTLHDGSHLTTLYELLRQAGWKRALVTTTEITHATPAGFAANAESRDHAEKIAQQYLDRHIDLLLGGGRKFFDPAQRTDKRNLKNDFTRAGYIVMETRAQLEAASPDRPWLGIFASSHLPFTIDHRQQPKLQAEVPTLPDMTRLALRKLERESHFILQVEGGRVDHACHNCDAAAAFHDQIAFDEAIDVCLEFQKRHPETLLLITTDHGTGNPGLNGTGTEYGKTNSLFANLLQVKASFPEITSLLKRKADQDTAKLSTPWFNAALLSRQNKPATTQAKTSEEIVATPSEIAEIIRAGTGYDLPLAKAETFARLLAKNSSPLYDLMNSDTTQLGQLLGNYLGIGWAGNAHTSDYVPLLTLGPGGERFAGFIQNTEIFSNYLALAKIDFRNQPETHVSRTGREVGTPEHIEEYQLA